MTTTETSQGLQLSITRHINAPPDRVYRAWTERDGIARWFAPNPAWRVEVTELDAREGGAYRVEMHDTEAPAPHTVVGRYLLVDPPARLRFTWAFEGSDEPETLVEVTLAAKDGGTELTLTHSRFTTPQAVADHTEGWEGCLAQLANAVTA